MTNKLKKLIAYAAVAFVVASCAVDISDEGGKEDEDRGPLKFTGKVPGVRPPLVRYEQPEVAGREQLFILLEPVGDDGYELKVSGKVSRGYRAGVWVTHYRGGESNAVRETISYNDDGIIDGPYNAFYENGRPGTLHEYKDGLIEGRYFVFWQETGAIKIRGEFEGGRPVGVWHFYSEDGSLLKQRDAITDAEFLEKYIQEKPSGPERAR